MAKFDENPKLKKAREQLADLFASKSRGELIPHEDIEKLIGIKRADERYYGLVRKAGEKHEETKGVSVISEPTLGYLMATHEQQFGLLGARTRRAGRQLKKGRNSVDALPEEELSDHQRRLKAACVDNGNQSIASLRKDQALHNYLMRRKPGEPLKIAMREKEIESA